GSAFIDDSISRIAVNSEEKVMAASSKFDFDYPDANAHRVHRTTVSDGIEISYVHEGIGGVPLLLVHGWPGTKRIFYRNIGPLADAGFEVVAPDFRGWGDSVPPA